jgi:hypothetical protein
MRAGIIPAQAASWAELLSRPIDPPRPSEAEVIYFTPAGFATPADASPARTPRRAYEWAPVSQWMRDLENVEGVRVVRESFQQDPRTLQINDLLRQIEVRRLPRPRIGGVRWTRRHLGAEVRPQDDAWLPPWMLVALDLDDRVLHRKEIGVLDRTQFSLTSDYLRAQPDGWTSSDQALLWRDGAYNWDVWRELAAGWGLRRAAEAGVSEALAVLGALRYHSTYEYCRLLAPRTGNRVQEQDEVTRVGWTPLSPGNDPETFGERELRIVRRLLGGPPL